MSRKSKTVLGVVVGGALLVGSFGAVAASADSARPNHHAFRQVSQPTIGDSVRDGQFELVVTGIDFSGVRVGSDVTVGQPRDELLVVRLMVRNHGDSELFAPHAKVLVQSSRPYRAGKATWKAMKRNTFVRPIPTGGVVTGKLVFDIPKNGKPTVLKLRGSMNSQGVRMKLRW